MIRNPWNTLGERIAENKSNKPYNWKSSKEKGDKSDTKWTGYDNSINNRWMDKKKHSIKMSKYFP